MFTRNYWKYIVRSDALYDSSLILTSKEKPDFFITVSGQIPEKKLYSNSSISYLTPSTSIGYITKNNLNYIGTSVDVSENIENNSSSRCLNYSYAPVIFGSGNEPATIDDYKFSGETITNITYSYTQLAEYAEDGSKSESGRIYTITNNNDFDITIGEVGIFGEICYQIAYNTYGHYFVLFERTALENPITIPANGGVGQVTYIIKMEYPAPPIEE